MFVFVCDVQDGEIPWRSEWVCPSSVFLLCTINTRTERSRQLCILLLSVSRCRLGQCNVNIVWNTWECVYYCVCFRETQMDRRCRGRQVSEGRPLGCGSKARRKRREEKCKVSAMVAADSCPSPRIHRCPLTTRRPSALVYFCLCTFVSQVSALPSFFSCHLKIEEGSYWQTAASVEEEVAKRKTRLWGGRTWGRGREIWMKCPSITFLNLSDCERLFFLSVETFGCSFSCISTPLASFSSLSSHLLPGLDPSVLVAYTHWPFHCCAIGIESMLEPLSHLLNPSLQAHTVPLLPSLLSLLFSTNCFDELHKLNFN